MSANCAKEIESTYGNGQSADIHLRSASRAPDFSHAHPTRIRFFKESDTKSRVPEFFPEASDGKSHLARSRQQNNANPTKYNLNKR